MGARRTVFFSGRKARGMEALRASFREVFDEVKAASRADFVVHVDRDGTAGVLGDVVDGSDPRSIGIATNPLGVRAPGGGAGAGQWGLVRVCRGSLSPELETRAPAWDPGRWQRLAARHGLPRAPGWRRDRPADADVVLLLPKLGGWLGLSPRRFADRYSGHVRELREAHPESAIVVRVHPRNVARPDASTRTVLAALRRAAPGVRVDTAASVPEEQYERTKLVACDWSTAVTQFVMRGVPVCNPDAERPGRMIAAAAVGGGLSPDEVLDGICQAVWEPGDGEALRRMLRE